MTTVVLQTADYTARVARGAALLDTARPGWWREIALDQLAMESCHVCILGQLYGHYEHGFREIVIPQSASRRFGAAEAGFTLHANEQNWHTDDEYQEALARFGALADVWRALIRARLAIA